MRSVAEIEEDLELVLCFGLQGYNLRNVMVLEQELREAKKEERREAEGLIYVIPDQKDLLNG